ncbi:unnamed protein product [Nippostrongylus brasiliensis]|uniref:Monocarboxylate transporter 14 n=1 Tax=Nippostrongylus brasiliensis TaxID=27835 RepID=A0A0N4YXZ7_NIPBR|nr:unnamed protein product [Nippostrongylus brasiliensis]
MHPDFGKDKKRLIPAYHFVMISDESFGSDGSSVSDESPPKGNDRNTAGMEGEPRAPNTQEVVSNSPPQAHSDEQQEEMKAAQNRKLPPELIRQAEMNEKQDSKSNGNTASSYPHKVVNDEYGSNKSRSNSQESNSPSGSEDKVEEKSDDADLGVPPIDTCHLAFAIVLLNGIGVLLPWNMFITIAPNVSIAKT